MVNDQNKTPPDKWHDLYNQNPCVYPSENPNANGYVFEDWLSEIVEEFPIIHYWADNSGQGYHFRVADDWTPSNA